MSSSTSTLHSLSVMACCSFPRIDILSRPKDECTEGMGEKAVWRYRHSKSPFNMNPSFNREEPALLSSWPVLSLYIVFLATFPRSYFFPFF